MITNPVRNVQKAVQLAAHQWHSLCIRLVFIVLGVSGVELLLPLDKANEKSLHLANAPLGVDIAQHELHSKNQHGEIKQVKLVQLTHEHQHCVQKEERAPPSSLHTVSCPPNDARKSHLILRIS